MNFLESYGSVNRTREDRLLEHWSPRKLFVSLLVSVFGLGGIVALTAYKAFRNHRFDWSENAVLLLLVVLAVPLFRAIYRQLGR
jgi:hypothetical protein